MQDSYQKYQLPTAFFERATLDVARDLIGSYLVHRITHTRTLVGRIVETEAYLADDPACHAYRNVLRQRKGLPAVGRSLLLFGKPGVSYVYLNYGIHWLYNVVTEKPGVPGAVLIRALEPIEGLDIMAKNRSFCKNTKNLTSGPGKLAQAMGIGSAFNGKKLGPANKLWITARRKSDSPPQVKVSTRIGISQASDRQWRFYEHDNPWVSVLK